jgi:hypothetical protein
MPPIGPRTNAAVARPSATIALGAITVALASNSASVLVLPSTMWSAPLSPRRRS